MRPRWDWLLFVQILAIGTISLLIIFSITKSLATNQMVFWVAGLVILYISSQFDYENWKNLAIPVYAISLVFLLVLLVIGDPVRGSVRWIDLGIFRFQPSELAKAASIFLLATFYRDKSAEQIKNLFVSFLIILPAIAMVLIQPDLGNTLAFFAIWLGISMAAGFKPKHMVILFAAALIIGISLFEMLAPYQKQRITSFIDPTADPLGTGYNMIQSKIAVGSGGFLGKGFSRGSQSQLNFLPEAESDFIFASIAEQLGFLGAGLLIALFAWMITRIIGIAKAKDKFAQLLVVGVASFLMLQFLISVGMNMGILPVTGITFPLVSYGGSSLLTTLFLLGVVFSVARKGTY